MTIFREEVTSALSGFHAGLLSWSNWNLEILVFMEGGKPENLKKNSWSKARANIWHTAGIKPWPQKWEASALTPAPSLLTTSCFGGFK